MNGYFTNGYPSLGDARVSIPKISISTPSIGSGFVHIPNYVKRRNYKRNTQHVKDFGDLILGAPGSGTRQLQETLIDNDSLFTYVPILNRVAGLYWMSRERFIDPLFQGNVGKVLINAMETIGGTLDIAANPVKSLLPVAGGGTEQDFLKSMGWLDGEYRETYQWDSGNFIVDFLGEMVSDPINWFTWGSSAMTKNAIGKLTPDVQSLLQNTEIAYKTAEGVVKNTNALETFNKLTAKEQKKILEAVGEALIYDSEEKLIKRLEKLFVDRIIEDPQLGKVTVMSKTARNLYMDERTFLSFQGKVIKANQSGLYDAYKKIIKARDIAKGIDVGLARIARDLTPIGWTGATIKYVIKPAFASVNEFILRRMKQFEATDIMDRGRASFTRLTREAHVKAEAVSDYAKTGMKQLLESYNLSWEAVNNMYLDAIGTATGATRDYITLREYFKKELLSRMEGVYVAGFGKTVWSPGIPLASMTESNFRSVVNALELQGIKMSQVKIIIPEDVYNDLFWEIWSTNKEIINAQNKFISNHLDIFKEELKRAYTDYNKKADILNRPYNMPNTPYSGQQLEREKFVADLEQAIKQTNSDIRELKGLAYKILSTADGWNGSYMDKQQFWLLLKENNPSTTLTTLGQIIELGISKDANNAVRNTYQEYLKIYNNLLDRINSFATQGWIKNGFLNTHERHSPGVVLDTLYTYYNGLTNNARTSQYPIRDIIGYLDGGFLSIKEEIWNRYPELSKKYKGFGALPGGVYDLNHIEDFFKEAQMLGMDTTHHKAILEYFGITTDNASLVKQLYNKRDALAMNELQLILEQGKTGRRAYSAQIDSFKNIWMKENKHYNHTAEIVKDVELKLKQLTEGKETMATYSEAINKSVVNLRMANEYLHNIQLPNIPAYEMPIFEKLLDQLGIPAHEFDEMWRSLFSQDFTALTPDTYLDVVNRAANLLSTIETMRDLVKGQGASLPEYIDKFLTAIERNINDYIMPLETNVANLIDLSQAIYIPQLSKEARMRLLIDAEFAHMDTRYGQWFEKLKHADSKERKALDELINRLRDAGLTDAGDQLKMLTLQIDQHVIVNRLLNMNVQEMYVKLDKDTLDYIRAALYNKISTAEYINASPTTLANLSVQIANEVTDDVMNYIRRYKMEDITASQELMYNYTLDYIGNHAKQHGIELVFVEPSGERVSLGRAIHEVDKGDVTHRIELLHPAYYDDSYLVNPAYKDWFDRNGTLFRLQGIEDFAKTPEERTLYAYFHEFEHLKNKDYKKAGFERNFGSYKNVVHEAQARIAEYAARRDLSSVENILKAERQNIYNTYLANIRQYATQLHKLEVSGKASGIKTNDVLDGKIATLIRNIGNNSPEVLKALKDFEADDELFSDYLETLTNLLGRDTAMEHKAIVTEWKKLSKATLARYTPSIEDAEIMQNFKRTFDYIGRTNDKLSGMTGATKDYAHIANLMTKAELEEVINRAGYEANIAEYSMMNKYIAFRKVFDPKDALTMGIRPYQDVIVTDQAKYLDFYNKFQDNYERAKHLLGNYNAEQLTNLKTYLIDNFKHAGIGITPINAETYFRLLDATNKQDQLKLITWGSLLIEKPNKVISKYSSLEKFRDPWLYLEMVDNVFKDNTLINVDGISNIISLDPPSYVLEDLYPRYDFSISSLYKSPEQLKRTQIPFNKYIQDDLAARHYTVDTILKHKEEWSSTKISDVSDTLADVLGVKNDTRLDSNAVQYFVKETVQLDEAATVAKATPAQLRTIIDERGGFIIYIAEEGEEPFSALTEDVQQQYGLMLHKEADNIYFIRRTDNLMHNEKITWYRSLPQELDFMIDQKEDILRYNKNYIDLRGTTIPYYYLTGDTMDNVLYDYILESDHFSTFFGDKSVQETYLKYDFDDNTSFYKKAYSRPQFTIVGKNGYNRFLDYLKYGLGVETNFTQKNLRFDNSLQNGMFDWITRHNNKIKLLSLFANDETLLDNEIYHKMLDHLDNNQLQDMFRKGNYTAVVIKEVNGKPKVFPFYITSQKDLNNARKQGAHIFTEAIYRNLQLTINKENISNNLLRMYRQTVVGGYKSIWLTTPGALMRNAIDSLVYKNLNETGGAVSMFEMFRYEYQAGKLLDFVNNIQAEVFARTDGKTFNREILTEVLMKLPKEDRQLYYFVDAFVSSGASGSLTDSMQEFLLQFNKTKDAGYAWERVINSAIFESNFSPTKWAMDINGKIEQTARLGLFLALVDKLDVTIDEALSRVIRTHFDYTVKTGLEDLIEQVFWFSTFPINNLLYFINGGLERNPVMLKAMMDLNELSWNNGEYTYDEIADKPYLQYHVLQGNLRWRSKDGKKDYIFKLGPSLFDFYNVIVNPHGEAVDRLNPFLAVATGREGLAELNPINTHISRFFRLINGETLLPSVYNKKDVYNRNKKYYTKYNYDQSSWNSGSVRTYPKRFKKPRTALPQVAYKNRHYFTRKYYVHDSRWNNRFMKPITYEPYFDPTSNKYRGQFNRQRRQYIKLPTITPEMRPFLNNKREIT